MAARPGGGWEGMMGLTDLDGESDFEEGEGFHDQRRRIKGRKEN